MEECKLCGSRKSVVVREYRGNVPPFDSGLNIVRCTCSVERAAPMPDQATLEAYYRSGTYEEGH